MASIKDQIRNRMPETFAILDGKYKNIANVDIIDQRIPVAMELLFKPGVVESTLTSEFVKAYVGDVVTRMVIPAGIDYWQVKTRRSDSINKGPGVTPLGGESSQNYDRVKGLQDLDKLIAASLAANKDEFEELAGDLIRGRKASTVSIIGSSTQGTEHTTPSPDDFANEQRRREHIYWPKIGGG